MNNLLNGRPNVGKSSINNILTRSNSNIIHKESGTTRDWHKGNILSIPGNYIYDTPGIISKSDELDETARLNGKILFVLFNFKFKSKYSKFSLIGS